jgi:cation diffusion facilitator family transporter
MRDPRLRWALTSVGVSVALGLVKFLAWRLTGSPSVFSDAVESLVNVTAASFATYSVWLSGHGPDANHPYGHGKVEYLSAGFEGALILVASLAIVREAVAMLIAGAHVEQPGLGTVLVALTALGNGGLGLALMRAGRRHQSPTLTADGRHLMTDAVTSFGAVAALLLVLGTGVHAIDPAIAILLGLHIGWTGLKVVRHAISGIMNEVDAALMQRLRDVIERELPAGVIDVHDLRAWQEGASVHIDAHLTLPPDWPLTRCREVTSALEAALRRELGGVETLFHLDAAPRVPGTPVRRPLVTVWGDRGAVPPDEQGGVD